VQVRIGNGGVTYVASSLEQSGYVRLLDALARAAGVDRTVRVRNVEGDSRVEARFATFGKRQLLYVFNAGAKAINVQVERSGAPIRSISALRESRWSSGNRLTIPARQTNLYELF